MYSFYLFLSAVGGDSLVFASVTPSGYWSGNPLPLKHVKTIKGSQWNNVSSTFALTEALGVYFVGYSVKPYSSNPISYNLVVHDQTHSGLRHTGSIYNTIGRELVIQLVSADSLKISTTPYNVISGSALETSITIFSLSDSMTKPNSTVAFSVFREDTLCGWADPVSFRQVLYQSGNSYFDMDRQRFEAPSSGIYYFTYSLGLVNAGRANLALYKNDETIVTALRTATSIGGDDTMGRSVLIHLDKGDTVRLVNDVAKTARSSSLKETSFSGFKYEPATASSVSAENRILMN